ncbi:MAG: DUF4357 domain-containing protein [Bacteroidota bacterium]|nr:DUF4357 domain-containing protein [Bacteroidota bacterium]
MERLEFNDAKACIQDHRFVVLAGSKVRAWDQAQKGWSYETLQKKLARSGRLRWLTPEFGVFTEDVSFSSPSAAASIVNGAPVSGPASWVEESTGLILRILLQQRQIHMVDPVFKLTMPKIGVDAKARLNGDRIGLMVLSDSIVRAKWVGLNIGYARLNRQLLADGTIRRSTGVLGHLTRDVEFSSASAAASIVKGNNANGKSDWKIEGAGETYYEWRMDEEARR